MFCAIYIYIGVLYKTDDSFNLIKYKCIVDTIGNIAG